MDDAGHQVQHLPYDQCDHQVQHLKSHVISVNTSALLGGEPSQREENWPGSEGSLGEIIFLFLPYQYQV